MEQCDSAIFRPDVEKAAHFKRPLRFSRATVYTTRRPSNKRSRKAHYLAKGKNEIPESVFLGPGRIIWEDGKPIGREEGQRVEMYNVKNRY